MLKGVDEIFFISAFYPFTVLLLASPSQLSPIFFCRNLSTTPPPSTLYSNYLNVYQRQNINPAA